MLPETRIPSLLEDHHHHHQYRKYDCFFQFQSCHTAIYKVNMKNMKIINTCTLVVFFYITIYCINSDNNISYFIAY